MPARVTPNPSPSVIPPSLTPAEFAQMMRLPPEQAVKFLQDKGVVVTGDWRALWQEEHAHQFTISRLARSDLLEAIQKRLVQSVNGDLSRRDWMRQTEDMLRKEGWWGDVEVLDKATGEILTTRFNSQRMRLIFDVNTRSAYAAGQWQRFEQTKRALPYLRYVTKRDERVRDEHSAWDNLTLPVDDPFWNTHAPPNGWNCRCKLVGVTQKDYDKGLSPRGAPLNKTAPPIEYRDWRNAKTGITERVPKGIDPGWAYNPGKPQMRNEAMDKVVGNKLEKLSPDMAQAARRAGLKKKVDPRALAASDALMTGLLAKAQASAGNDAIALLRYLFRSEYNYTRHVGKRLKAGDIDSEQAYAEMTLMVLASAETLVLAMPPEGVTSLLAATGKIATSDGRWIVLLNADGGIVTSYPYVIGEGGFEKNHAENGHYFYEISLGSDNRAALAALFGAD